MNKKIYNKEYYTTNNYKDYLNSLVGLSWQAYQQGIEIKKKNDDENSNI